MAFRYQSTVFQICYQDQILSVVLDWTGGFRRWILPIIRAQPYVSQFGWKVAQMKDLTEFFNLEQIINIHRVMAAFPKSSIFGSFLKVKKFVSTRTV